MTPGQGHFWPQGHKLNKLGKGPPDDAPCFSTNQNNLNNFGRGSPKDHLYQVIFKFCPVVFDKKIFKVFPFGCRGNQNSAWNGIV